MDFADEAAAILALSSHGIQGSLAARAGRKKATQNAKAERASQRAQMQALQAGRVQAAAIRRDAAAGAARSLQRGEGLSGARITGHRPADTSSTDGHSMEQARGGTHAIAATGTHTRAEVAARSVSGHHGRGSGSSGAVRATKPLPAHAGAHRRNRSDADSQVDYGSATTSPAPSNLGTPISHQPSPGLTKRPAAGAPTSDGVEPGHELQAVKAKELVRRMRVEAKQRESRRRAAAAAESEALKAELAALEQAKASREAVMQSKKDEERARRRELAQQRRAEVRDRLASLERKGGRVARNKPITGGALQHGAASRARAEAQQAAAGGGGGGVGSFQAPQLTITGSAAGAGGGWQWQPPQPVLPLGDPMVQAALGRGQVPALPAHRVGSASTVGPSISGRSRAAYSVATPSSYYAAAPGPGGLPTPMDNNSVFSAFPAGSEWGPSGSFTDNSSAYTRPSPPSPLVSPRGPHAIAQKPHTAADTARRGVPSSRLSARSAASLPPIAPSAAAAAVLPLRDAPSPKPQDMVAALLGMPGSEGQASAAGLAPLQHRTQLAASPKPRDSALAGRGRVPASAWSHTKVDAKAPGGASSGAAGPAAVVPRSATLAAANREVQHRPVVSPLCSARKSPCEPDMPAAFANVAEPAAVLASSPDSSPAGPALRHAVIKPVPHKHSPARGGARSPGVHGFSGWGDDNDAASEHSGALQRDVDREAWSHDSDEESEDSTAGWGPAGHSDDDALVDGHSPVARQLDWGGKTSSTESEEEQEDASEVEQSAGREIHSPIVVPGQRSGSGSGSVEAEEEASTEGKAGDSELEEEAEEESDAEEHESDAEESEAGQEDEHSGADDESTPASSSHDSASDGDGEEVIELPVPKDPLAARRAAAEARAARYGGMLASKPQVVAAGARGHQLSKQLIEAAFDADEMSSEPEPENEQEAVARIMQGRAKQAGAAAGGEAAGEGKTEGGAAGDDDDGAESVDSETRAARYEAEQARAREIARMEDYLRVLAGDKGKLAAWNHTEAGAAEPAAPQYTAFGGSGRTLGAAPPAAAVAASSDGSQPGESRLVRGELGISVAERRAAAAARAAAIEARMKKA